jgi:hypothetical protein
MVYPYHLTLHINKKESITNSHNNPVDIRVTMWVKITKLRKPCCVWVCLNALLKGKQRLERCLHTGVCSFGTLALGAQWPCAEATEKNRDFLISSFTWAPSSSQDQLPAPLPQNHSPTIITCSRWPPIPVNLSQTTQILRKNDAFLICKH